MMLDDVQYHMWFGLISTTHSFIGSAAQNDLRCQVSRQVDHATMRYTLVNDCMYEIENSFDDQTEESDA